MALDTMYELLIPVTYPDVFPKPPHVSFCTSNDMVEQTWMVTSVTTDLTFFQGFAQVYVSMLAAATGPLNESRPYARILEHLAGDSSPPTPVLIHCTAGKDRTGVICALILSLCGVEDEIVAHEYSLTNLGLKSRHLEIIAHLKNEAAFKDDPNGAYRMVLAR